MTVAINTGQVTLAAGAVGQIVAARSTRTDLRLRASALGNLFLGADNTVTASTGYNPQVGSSDGVGVNGMLEYLLPIQVALWAYNNGNNPVTVQFLEVYTE